MKDEWRWIGADGFEYSGSIDRLRESLEDGKLEPDTQVWREGLDEWLPARAVPELRDVARERPFAPMPEMKTPPPVGISADAVVVRPPQGQMTALTPPAAPAAPVAEAPAPAPKRRSLVFALVGGIGGLVVLGLIWALGAYAGSQAKQTAGGTVPVASASASAEPDAPRVTRCVTNRTKPLSKPVLGKVPLVVSPTPDSAALVIGFAETRALARSVTVDSETLAVRGSKQERATAAIVGVVPLIEGGEPGLAVDVEDTRLRAARTIEADPAFEIGIGPDGIARRSASGELGTIWEGDSDAESTVPRADGSRAAGFFVTLRRGGLAGRVLAGWLGPDGAKRSALESVELTAAQVGTPTAAVGSSGVLLAVAVRTSAEAPWDVALGSAEPGKVPARLSPLSTPRASESAHRMSPAVAALADGRWALQWTERTPKGHVVRVQLLDPALAPASEPVTVSPEGSESGQGELWARDGRLVSLFLVRSGEGHELWGSVVGCL